MEVGIDILCSKWRISFDFCIGMMDMFFGCVINSFEFYFIIIIWFWKIFFKLYYYKLFVFFIKSILFYYGMCSCCRVREEIKNNIIIIWI